MDIALFSPSSLFADSDGDGAGAEEVEIQSNQNFVERKGTNFLECGTGPLAIFLHKSFAVDITTSDYDDVKLKRT